MTLSEKHFEDWLGRYGEAWEARDANTFAGIFSENAIYYWNPFAKPQKGREEIAAAVSSAVENQRDIDFGARVLYVQAQLGAAHWSCAFTRPGTGKRVHIDGVLVVQFDDSGEAISFREWWHTDEG